jgi:serine/threonine-protein kinase
MFLLGKDGYVRAQWPLPGHGIFEHTFAFRDYFRGGRDRAERRLAGPYISRAFRSEGDGHFKFAISAPVFHEGEWIGLVIAMINANSAFGDMRMDDDEASGRISALLGPRDNEREAAPDAPAPDGFRYVVHPGLATGDERQLSASTAALLPAGFLRGPMTARPFTFHYVTPFSINDYHDPVTDSPDSWLAAFAPVGETGYVMLVQTRKDVASPLSHLLTHRLTLWVALPLGLGLGLVGLASFLVARRRRALSWPATAT